MKNNSCKAWSGFTLIEVMAVITIIVILAGLVVGGLGFVNERQAKETAKVQIALLEKAIEEYKMDMGVYPGTSESPDGTGVSDELYTALFYEGYLYTNPETPPEEWDDKATKIYLPELDPRTSKQGWVTSSSATVPPATMTILDPWGNEYRYRKGADAQNPDFDLWSMGKDGKTNASDPSISQEDNKDDIRNF